MPTYAVETIWRSQNLHYRRLDTLSVRIATLLEGKRRTCGSHLWLHALRNEQKGRDRRVPEPDPDGEVTGIGIIGKNGLLLHSNTELD